MKPPVRGSSSSAAGGYPKTAPTSPSRSTTSCEQIPSPQSKEKSKNMDVWELLSKEERQQIFQRVQSRLPPCTSKRCGVGTGLCCPMMPNVELHPDQLREDDQRGALSLPLRIGKAMMNMVHYLQENLNSNLANVVYKKEPVVWELFCSPHSTLTESCLPTWYERCPHQFGQWI